MNEEEKKAIEDMNRFANGIDMSCVTARQMQIILNLIEKLQKENEELTNQEATARRINELLVQRYSNSIPVQKVKDKIEELQKEYNKLDKQVDEYIKSAEKDVSTYYENKERISIIQTLSYFIGILQELLESEE